jgi:hypothetical protein
MGIAGLPDHMELRLWRVIIWDLRRWLGYVAFPRRRTGELNALGSELAELVFLI